MAAPAERLSHHDLCFGCGQANVFGLQLEVEAEAGDRDGVAGRFFVKQDHQGPPGFAHGGILAAALDEAMALAVYVSGVDARTTRLELDLLTPAPVGTFVAVEASIEGHEGGRVRTVATASGEDGDALARARAEFALVNG